MKLKNLGGYVGMILPFFIMQAMFMNMGSDAIVWSLLIALIFFAIKTVLKILDSEDLSSENENE